MRIYLHFLTFFNTEVAYSLIEILLHGRQAICLSCVINTMAADDLAMQGARASAAMVLS